MEPIPQFNFDGLVTEARGEIAAALGTDWYETLDPADQAVVDEAIRVTAASAFGALSIDWTDPEARGLLESRRRHVTAQLANLGSAKAVAIAGAVGRAVAAVLQRGVVIALGALV